MYQKPLATLLLTLLAATAVHAGPYDRFIGMSVKTATLEAERQGFVYVTALDNSGNNESFLWRRSQSCFLFAPPTAWWLR